MLYNETYNHDMTRIRQTATFRRWLRGLRDRQARRRIVARLDVVTTGHFGDVRRVGVGISELRIDYGPGYRLYFSRRGAEIIVLLCGGDKGSQRRDIERAKRLAAELEE